MIRLVLALIFVWTQALAHDGMEKHEQFYAKWNRPDIRAPNGSRYQSCCNKMDCAPATVRPDPRGGWLWRDHLGNWVKIREEALEHNHTDELETPDGRSHVCNRGTFVICAVIGTGS